ncbi:MAG: RNA polymerase sigma factor [Proteobacteria bacterium]|jgi:RNA polymerase sigma-70 factor (ECF subfamily)|nr:RNA polymerase sigma factor [Pseudomonadota bacterium]
MAATNKEKSGGSGKGREGKSMSVGVLEKLGIGVRRKVKADPIADVVARCKHGDTAAFRELYDRHVSGVHRHLKLLIGPNEDVDDLIQLVFLNVFQSIKRFKGESAFSTWLFRITINVARQEIRVRGRQRRLGTAVVDVSRVTSVSVRQTPEHRVANWEHIYAILDRLSPKKRETFILYMYEGYSLEEIARLLGSSVSTIGSRLQAGRREILDALAGEKAG